MANTTRKQRAAELLRTLERGPTFSATYADLPKDQEALQLWAKRQYRIWSKSWVLGDLQRLVPELKNAKISHITSDPLPYEP